MAVMNRPLNKAEIETLLKAPPLVFRDTFLSTTRDGWPLMVHYRVGLEGNKPQFTPRDTYRVETTGPSDCCWIVPGSVI